MSLVLKYGLTTLLVTGMAWGVVELLIAWRHYQAVRIAYLPVAKEIRQFTPGGDPNKFYVRCVVNRPLHLAWRFTVPNGKYTLVMQSGTSFMMTEVHGGPEIWTSAWEIDRGEEMSAVRAHFTSASASASKFSGMDLDFTQFLESHWDELDISILGLDATEEIAKDECVTLLRIDFSKELIEQAPANVASRLSGPLVICIGKTESINWSELPDAARMRKLRQMRR